MAILPPKPAKRLTGALVSSVNALAIIDVLELLKDYKFSLFYKKYLIVSNYSNQDNFGVLLQIHELMNLKKDQKYCFYEDSMEAFWKDSFEEVKLYIFDSDKNVENKCLESVLEVFINSEAISKFSEHIASRALVPKLSGSKTFVLFY